jgi:hypothetical protein
MDVPYDKCSSFAPKIPAAAFAMFEVDYRQKEKKKIEQLLIF